MIWRFWDRGNKLRSKALLSDYLDSTYDLFEEKLCWDSILQISGNMHICRNPMKHIFSYNFWTIAPIKILKQVPSRADAGDGRRMFKFRKTPNRKFLCRFFLKSSNFGQKWTFRALESQELITSSIWGRILTRMGLEMSVGTWYVLWKAQEEN